MNKIILTILLTVSNVFANTYVGVVKDVSTGSPIADANIVVSGIEEIGLTTNEKGFFSLHTDTDSIMIRVNAIGYTQYNQSYNTNENEFIYISMDKKSIELSPVEVIADRASLIGATKNFFRLAGSSSLISRAEVIEFNDTDINRVISQVPGVYTQEEDGYGLRPNIGMRGSGLERSAKINMMEDGIPIAPAPYSSPAAYYSPTAGRMESFEIRKGSSQIKYGPHSTGGAINYISASIPEKLKFQGTVSTGSFGTRLGKFKTGVSSKNYGIMFQTLLDKTDGFKSIDGGDETGFSKNDYLFKARLNTDREFAAAELKISQTNEISNETYLGLIRSDFAKDPFRRYRASQKDQMSADHNQISLTGALKLFRNTNITAALYQNGFHRNWYKLNKVGEQSISSILSGDESDVGYQLLSAENSADDVYDIKANNRDYKSQGLQSILRSVFKINNINRMNELVCDGVLVSTAAGSTAYNLSAYGSILPLDSALLALTPISAFRPRRWKGALLSQKNSIEFIVKNFTERTVSVTADNIEYRDIKSVKINSINENKCIVLFDSNHSMEDKILNEQFEF